MLTRELLRETTLEVREFIRTRPANQGEYYTTSWDYVMETTTWNLDERKAHVMQTIEKHISKSETVLDLGCASCITGLSLRKDGYNVMFSDFKGCAEEIAEHFAPGLFIPYGQELSRQFDWVIACDIVEHVPNILSFVRWVYTLCKKGVILTFPLVTLWQPPYELLDIDNYVDVELLEAAASRLFTVIDTTLSSKEYVWLK